ncbi:hypothetical protein [Peribacillus muralis]|uniref:hypothetical protein n=1 Tax=Peribacillus muralis TaxID=264697 RepID=UPI00367164E8
MKRVNYTEPRFKFNAKHKLTSNCTLDRFNPLQAIAYPEGGPGVYSAFACGVALPRRSLAPSVSL